MGKINEVLQAQADGAKATQDLTVQVNAAIVDIGTLGPTDAQLETVKQGIVQDTAAKQALTASIVTALTPPVVPPGTAPGAAAGS